MTSKYQIAVSALDQFSTPLKAARASFHDLTQDVKTQSAELKKLNTQAASLSAYADLKRDLSSASDQMKRAKTHTEQLAAATKTLQAQSAGFERSVSVSQSRLESLEAQMRLTERPSRALKSAWREAKAELKANNAALNQHLGQLNRTQADYTRARKEVSQLSKYVDTQTAKLHGLKSSLRESGVQTNRLGAAQRQVRRDITAANAALEQQKAKLNAVRAASARIDANRQARSELGSEALNLALKGAALALPVKLAVDYEAAFTDVSKAVNDATPQELEQMKREIVLKAPKLGVNQEGLAGIIAEGGRNGLKKEELFDYAAAAAKMSVAFDMSAEASGATMMKWRTTMGLTQREAERLADAVNHVGDNMATDAKSISEVLVRQGAVITNSGLDEIQAAALSGAVLSGSASNEIAATAVKNLLLSLTAGDAASGTQQDAMTTLGFDPAELAKDMQQNAPETVERVLLAIRDQDADVQTALMKDLFGSESIGSIAPLLKNLENFRKAFKLVEKDTNFAGSMQSEFDKQTATANFKINKFMATAAGFATTLGNTLLPPLGAALDVMTPVLAGMTELTQEFPALGAAIIGLPALLIATKAAFLAFKAGKLLLGQGKNYTDLGKAKLGMGLDGTAASATRAASRLSRLNQVMDGLGSSRTPIRNRGARFAPEKRPRRRPSTRGGKWGRLLGLGSTLLDFLPGVDSPSMNASSGAQGGRWKRRAAMLGGGAALSLMTASANAADVAMMGANAASLAGDVAGILPIKGLAAGLTGTAGKLFKPLNILLQGAALTSAIQNGDAKDIGATAGDMAGGLGGGALGATLGTFLLPGIGTFLGGALGSWLGGNAGEWLGEKAGSFFASEPDHSLSDLPEPSNVLPDPDAVRESLSNVVNDHRKVEITLNIPSSSGSAQQDEAMLERLVAKLKEMMLAEGVMGSDGLSVRMDGSLSDRGNG